MFGAAQMSLSHTIRVGANLIRTQDMNLFQKPVILAALLFPTVAFAQIGVGDVAGTNEAQILAFLEANGYTIQDVETDRSELEVEVMLDGIAYEIEIDLATGQITEIEAGHEDGDDDDDDDDDNYDDDDDSDDD